MPNKGYTRLFEIDKELTAAFKADCEEFLEAFENLNSFQFLDFAKLWRLKNFTYVFADHQYALILKDYINNCFHVVKKFIVFPKSLQTQVGALFLLYGLYYKQPLRGWVKVRITLDEYEKISELLEEMKNRGCFDASYIFSKMKLDQAIIFVAQRKILGPEHRFVKSFEIYYNDTFSVSKVNRVEQKFTELISDSDLLKELSETHSEYQDLLKKYSEKCNDLVPMNSTIMPELKEAYNKIISNEQLTEAQERAKSKRNIKNKALTTVGVYRAAKSVTVGDNECQPNGSGFKKSPKKRKN